MSIKLEHLNYVYSAGTAYEKQRMLSEYSF